MWGLMNMIEHERENKIEIMDKFQKGVYGSATLENLIYQYKLKLKEMKKDD